MSLAFVDNEDLLYEAERFNVDSRIEPLEAKQYGAYVEESEEDEMSFDQREMMRIRDSVETPLDAYARYMARLEIMSKSRADQVRLHNPVTRWWQMDIAYARNAWQNRIIMINGKTGTGKSLSGIGLTDELDYNGWEIEKCFWDLADLLNYLRTDAKRGDCLILDEEPKYRGVGSMSLDYAISNIEQTIRWNEINFIFIYVSEGSHKVHTAFYTRGVKFIEPPKADYFVLGLLQPVSGLNDYQLLGLMSVDVPSQKMIRSYGKYKKEFVEQIQASGGFGSPREILQEYEWLIKALREDDYFFSLDTHGKRVDYVSMRYRVPIKMVDIVMTLLTVR